MGQLKLKGGNMELHTKLDTVGARMKAVRLARQLGSGEVADRLSVSRTTYSAWEAGSVTKIDVHALLAFTKIAEVDLNWLVEGEGEVPITNALTVPVKNGDALPPPVNYGGDDCMKQLQQQGQMLWQDGFNSGWKAAMRFIAEVAQKAPASLEIK